MTPSITLSPAFVQRVGIFMANDTIEILNKSFLKEFIYIFERRSNGCTILRQN